MKKMLTSLLLLAVGVVSAQAYGLYVGGVQVTESNKGNITGSSISGSVKFDGNKTLTLTNATITAPTNSNGIANNDINGLIIKIVGNCKITGTSSGIRASMKTTILGDDYEAYLSVEGSNNYGVYVDEPDVVVDFNKIWASVKGKKTALFTAKSGCKLEFSWCDVTLSQSGTESCVQGFEEIKTWSVIYDYNGNSYDTSAKKLVDSNNNAVTNANFKARLCVGKYIFDVKNVSSTTINKDTKGAGITSGTVKYVRDTKELTFDGTTINTGSNCIVRNYAVDGLDVYFLATCKLSNTGNNSIYSVEDITLEANSRTQATVTINNTADANAIALGQYKSGRTITFETVGITVNAKRHCLSGNGGILKINESKVNLTTSGSSYYAANGFASCTMTKDVVNTAQTPVLFNSSKKGFTDISGTLAQKALIDVPTKTYNVTVCGQPVTDLNQTNILVDGLTAGKMLFNDNTNVWYFEMNKVTLTNNSGQEAIKTWGASKKFVIRCDGGTSTINQAGNEALYGLNSSAPMRLEGDNKLVLNVTGSTSYSGIRLFKMGLEVDLKGLDIVSDGYGINGVNGDEDVKLARRSYNTQYNLQGQNGPLKAGTLTLDQMDFDASATAGCYFDNKKIYQNGSSNTVTTNVRFSPVSETYGITIAGTPITNCNRMGVGSKYITKGGTTAVTFDGSKTLTLTDATINYGDDDKVCGIKNSNVDGLTIKLVGTNVITNSQNGYNSNNLPINIEANTTITGNGSLAVESLPVMTANNANLTFKDAKSVTFASSLRSTNNASNSILTVDNSNVTVNSSVWLFKNVTWPNGKLLTPVNGYYDTTERYFYDANGNKAQKVVFGDKNATAIDAVEFDNNAEVKTIYDAAGRETNTAKRGLNIIRMSDGTVRKVMVK